ncbi:MAG TPA: hypothetical protein VMG12_30455 [Polyangiaceae bacterium]|nr:hypothetical protein [Polyangiaceae bacterium]
MAAGAAFALLSAAMVSAALPARADEAKPATSGAERASATATPPGEPSDERALPDYDGRGGPATTPGQALLWVPRVILFPPYVVAEFVIRRPLGWLIAGAERSGLPAWLYDFFTFDDHRAGVVPTVLIDFDFYPSVGLYAFWNDVGFKGHGLRLRGAIGGEEWLAASFSDRIAFDEEGRDRLRVDVRAQRRPDFTFFGLGPDTRQNALVRYGQDLREATLAFDKGWWRASSLHAEVGLRAVDFRRGGYDDDPTLDEEVAAGALPLPPGYEDGYTLVRSRLAVAVDNRLARPASVAGWRLEAYGTQATNVRQEGTFIGYGGSGGYAFDLNDRNRIVTLGALVRFVDPIGDAQIPFTELVTLGGAASPMRGLYPGRLYDRSAAAAGLGYRWPIWIWLDGAIRMEVGNVFGEHLDGFRLERLRWSGALGVESVGTPDNSFELMVGAGSETFESGGKIDSFRFVFGTTSGF